MRIIKGGRQMCTMKQRPANPANTVEVSAANHHSVRQDQIHQTRDSTASDLYVMLSA